MENLTFQEESIMLIVWKLKECAVKDIINEIPEPRPPYTTVASVLKNLEDKDYVKVKRFGNVKVFSPLIEEKEYKKNFMQGVVKNYFDSSFKELVTFFAKEEKISSSDLEEIINMIENKK